MTHPEPALLKPDQAAELLGLELAPPRTPGYDAIRQTDSGPQRIQIKGFAYGEDAKPGQRLGTWCVSLTPRGISVASMAQRLRSGWPAVFGRVAKDRLLLDLRAVRPAEDALIVQAIERLRSEASSPTAQSPQTPSPGTIPIG